MGTARRGAQSLGEASHGAARKGMGSTPQRGGTVTITANGKRPKLGAVGEAPSNDAADVLSLSIPYVVETTITGTAALLFHRWSCEAVAEKASAAKNSAGKKTDNVESYVYRCDDGTIGLPGEYVRQAIIHAAKFRQDPRSPRKSAMDLYKAAVVSLTDLASLGSRDWDYLDQRRVMVQRNGVTRVRPAFHKGWTATLQLQVLLPEYVTPADLHHVLTDAGRLVGVADFRPTYGRFAVTSFAEVAG